MHACPQSDTFYNKVTKKRKREKVRESCLLFSSVTHLSPSSFIACTVLHSHNFIKIPKDCACHVCSYSIARSIFGLLALQQVTSVSRREKKKCVQDCRHHWIRRQILQFVATVSEENEYRGLTSLSENRVVNLKAIPLSTEDGRNARSFIIEIVKERKSRKTKFNWKEKVNLLLNKGVRTLFEKSLSNSFRVIPDTFQSPGPLIVSWERNKGRIGWCL